MTTEKGFLSKVFRNYLILIIAAILILTFLAKNYAFFPFDLYITKLIQQIDNGLFWAVMMFLSYIGNFYPTIISLIIASGVSLFYKRKDLAAGILVSSLGAVGISEILKAIVSRPRPDAGLIHQIEKFSRDDSFPSGHVLYFIGFYGFLLFLAFTMIKNKLWRNVISVVLVFMIIFIGVSRIYIGSHWFSDTLGSYLIGSVWLYTAIVLYQKFGGGLKNKV